MNSSDCVLSWTWISSSVTVLYFDQIPWWGVLLLSLSIGGAAMLVVLLFVVPFMKRKLEGECWWMTYFHVPVTCYTFKPVNAIIWWNSYLNNTVVEITWLLVSSFGLLGFDISIFRMKTWKWRQQGSPKCWYFTTALYNPEDLDLNLHHH
jgi:uncharacterized membrane protein YobD (UPF0266 family)